MKQWETPACPNCGTLLPRSSLACEDSEIGEMVCPTCQFHIRLSPSSHLQRMTMDDLRAQISALIDRSLASRLPVDQVAYTVGDALAFLIEHVYPDHRFFVGVVDLGSIDSQYIPRQTPDLVNFLRRSAASKHGC